MKPIEQIMRTAPVIPVLVIDDVHDARPIAEALVESGLKVLEVTLRTDCALEAIKRMNLVPGAIVGAGTVTNKQQLDDCVAAGAEFIVAIAGDIMTMPGLPRVPAANSIRLNQSGQIEGLF